MRSKETKGSTMACHDTMRRRRILTYAAFTLVFISLTAGSFFCMLKSPQARGDAYLAAAVDTLAAGDAPAALDLAHEALRHNPASSRNWSFYAFLMEKNGRAHAAARARHIALSLQHGTGQVEPLYAMPATLRLSLLADNGMTP